MMIRDRWHHFTAVFAAVLAICVALATAAMADDGRRYALVVGNSSYTAVPALPNPTNDASDIGGALTKAGFDVTYGLDVNRREFLSLIDQFAAKSRDGAAVVFFYAGHGFEWNKANQLVPVDARLKDRSAITAETIGFNTVIAALQQPGRPSIFLLDACRNNPLPPDVRDGNGEGLAEVDTGRDLFVAFAAEPHKTAKSGLGRNSPFTQSLLTHLRRPGLSISDMMVDVRKDVYLSTEGAQLPWDQSSLRSQFFFVPTLSITERLAQTSHAADGGVTAADAGTRSTTIDSGPKSEAAQSETAKTEVTPAENTAKVETPPADQTKTPGKTNEKRHGTRSNTKTEKDGPVRIPPVAKKTAKIEKPSGQQLTGGKRPSAVRYSVKIWSIGSISKGRRVRQRTEFGELVCLFLDERRKDTPYRFCSWH